MFQLKQIRINFCFQFIEQTVVGLFCWEKYGISCLYYIWLLGDLISFIYNDYNVYYTLPLYVVNSILVLVEHLIEGVVQLARDRVDLQLLPDDLVFQFVNPEDIMNSVEQFTKYLKSNTNKSTNRPMVELADVHLSILRSWIWLLEPNVQLLDLVLNEKRKGQPWIVKDLLLIFPRLVTWYFSSLLLAFSSDTSSCFWFSPMADNSSSMVTTW